MLILTKVSFSVPLVRADEQFFEKEKKMIDLSVNIAGIKLKNPIMPASGTFGYGDEYYGWDEIKKLGAVVTKGTKLLPTQGNKQPRIMEVQGGLINFIGLQNPGIEEAVRTKLPYLLRFEVPVIVNVCGSTVKEYVEVARRASESVVVSALEINISCPNVKQGGVAFGQDPVLAAEVTSAVREATRLPLILKLTPNVTSVIPIAEAVVIAGANAISLVNTFKARGKLRSGPNKGTWIEGGLSGPCIKHIALRMVSDLYKANPGVPIIGIGGIASVTDVLDFLESGAEAVQIGTGNFVDPMMMIKIIDGLKSYLKQVHCHSIKEWREKNFPMPKEKDTRL
jgi:dihydroorotate dehydrogenase (NAD+) catalytic subunit